MEWNRIEWQRMEQNGMRRKMEWNRTERNIMRIESTGKEQNLPIVLFITFFNTNFCDLNGIEQY